MKKVSFTTLGCKVNQYDTQAMQMAFSQKGFRIVPEGECADAIIVNTCTVTAEADRKSRQMIRRAMRSSPGALVVAAGCYVQGSPEAAAGIEGVGLLAGTADRLALVDAVELALSSEFKPSSRMLREVDSFGAYEELEAEGADGMSRAYIKIEDGCDSYCSYCFVPYVRGHVRSREIGNIREEAHRLSEAGYAEIILTGIHLGCYGRDFGGKPGLVEAIRAVCGVEGVRRVRLSSLEPTELTDELLGLFASEGKLARHLHLPLQSGDDRILSSMNRHYDTTFFEAAAMRARDMLGDIGLTTDVIAGFPGETEEMFGRTLEFVTRIGFTQVHAFPYSKRSGTPAASMPQQVPGDVKAERVRRLIEASEAIAATYRGRMNGRQFDVVIEKEEAGPPGKYIYDGYTSEYVKVRFSSEARLKGMVKVKVNEADAEGVEGAYVE